MLHFRCGGHQLAILHALGRDQFAGDLVDLVATAANYDHFQTVVFIQVDVQTGIYRDFRLVLHIG